MNEHKRQYISNIDILKDLSAQDVEGIDRSITMSTCPPGRVFYAPNVMEAVLFLLKKDQVQFYRLSS